MGTRYFDIRVNKVDGEYVIFHSIINGVKFLPILESIKNFVIENPTETLLLDFQHFNGGSQDDVYNFITEFFVNLEKPKMKHPKMLLTFVTSNVDFIIVPNENERKTQAFLLL